MTAEIGNLKRIPAVLLAGWLTCTLLAAQGPEFEQPPVKQSQDGLLNVELDVKCFQGTVDGHPDVYLRSYNGLLTGPTMRIKAGDVLRVHLSNNLSDGYCTIEKKTDCASRGMNCPHGFNVTNLHTHGLHVSPSGNSDNVLIEFEPGSDFQYEYYIPADHPAGTFFYHPHKHGSAAIQMSSGMGGAIIVQGAIDEFMAGKKIQERLFVFQQITFDEREVEGKKVNILEEFSQLQRNSFDRPTTVNGQVTPVLRMRPGQVERWRLVHSGIMEMITASLQDHKMHIYSYDGLNTGRLDTVDSYAMAPGYRVDVLIQAGKKGTYKLVDQANVGAAGIKNQDEPERVLAYLVVEGDPVSGQLPTAAELAPFAYKGSIPEPIAKNRKVIFAQQPRSLYDFFNVNGALFMANESPCNAQDIGFCMKLGSSEEWTITSQDQNHPFHIHVNPFQIIEGDCQATNSCIWKDTVLIRNGQDTVIRSYFKRYIGQFVFHCHILNHEDQGMMRLVEIRP